MKKIILAALLFLAALLNVNTSHAQQGFSISVKAAPQITNIKNKTLKKAPDFESGKRSTTSYGVGAGYNFTSKLGIAADVLYSSQGWKTKILMRGESSHQYTNEINYIKVPVFITYTTDPTSVFSFSAKVGPQVSFLHSSKGIDSAGHYPVPDAANLNTSYAKKTFGTAASAGVQVRLHQHFFLTTSMRVDHDSTNADAPAIANVRSPGPSHNTTKGFEIGLKYVLN